jgi:hypothetical protein
MFLSLLNRNVLLGLVSFVLEAQALTWDTWSPSSGLVESPLYEEQLPERDNPVIVPEEANFGAGVPEPSQMDLSGLTWANIPYMVRQTPQWNPDFELFCDGMACGELSGEPWGNGFSEGLVEKSGCEWHFLTGIVPIMREEVQKALSSRVWEDGIHHLSISPKE